MSVAVKLHILLVVTILGVGMYMFMLYKEIRMFEKDLTDLRIKVNALSSSTLLPSNILDIVSNKKSDDNQTQPVNVKAEALESIDDDNDSVSSNEIKEILTNIHQDDVVDNETEIVPIDDKDKKVPEQNEEEITLTLKSEGVDYSTCTDEFLQTQKYDDLRNFLRKKSIHIKGTKQDIINKILSLAPKQQA